MAMVENFAALDAGYVAVRADEVLAGDLLYQVGVVVPEAASEGLIRMSGSSYHPGARVYVRR